MCPPLLGSREPSPEVRVASFTQSGHLQENARPRQGGIRFSARKCDNAKMLERFLFSNKVKPLQLAETSLSASSGHSIPPFQRLMTERSRGWDRASSTAPPRKEHRA